MGTHAEPDKGPSASWQVMTGACGGEGSHPSRPPVGSLRRAGAAGGEVEGKWQEQPGEVALGGEGHVAETLPPASLPLFGFSNSVFITVTKNKAKNYHVTKISK